MLQKLACRMGMGESGDWKVQVPPLGPRCSVDALSCSVADRSLEGTVNKWGRQISLDTSFDIMKEFWLDLRRKLFGG
jgi:hypothetical protein